MPEAIEKRLRIVAADCSEAGTSLPSVATFERAQTPLSDTLDNLKTSPLSRDFTDAPTWKPISNQTFRVKSTQESDKNNYCLERFPSLRNA